VYKMLDELLPPDTRLSQQCRELFVECCTEFINLVSSESLDVSEKDGKKIIGPEHVIKAVEVRGSPRWVCRTLPAWRGAAAAQAWQ
jgi:histone H3/H4